MFQISFLARREHLFETAFVVNQVKLKIYVFQVGNPVHRKGPFCVHFISVEIKLHHSEAGHFIKILRVVPR